MDANTPIPAMLQYVTDVFVHFSALDYTNDN